MVGRGFVGRAAQVGDCLAGEPAWVVLVSGPPGAGRTRLLAEVAARGAGPVRWAAVVTAAEVERSADEGGLLVVDDVHLADAPTRRLLADVVRDRPGRLRLLLSARAGRCPTELVHAVLVAGPAARHVSVPPLTDDEVAELLPEVGPVLRGRIAAAGAGIPRYLLALAELPPHTWPARGPGEGVDRPLAVEERPILAELAGLPAAERAVVRAAAHCGTTVDVDLVRVLSDRSETEVTDLLESLVRHDVLVSDDAGLRFRHPLVHAAAHRLAPESREFGAHHRAVRHLRARDAPLRARAYHLEKSHRHHDLRAVRELVGAAKAVADTCPVTSARWLGVALRDLPERLRGTPEHVEAALLHVRALVVAGRPAQARERLVELSAWLPPGDPRTLTPLARCEQDLGRPRRARAILEEVEAHTADPELRLELTALRLADDDPRGAVECAERLLGTTPGSAPAAGSALAAVAGTFAAAPAPGPARAPAVRGTAHSVAAHALRALALLFLGRVAEARAGHRTAVDGFDLLGDEALRDVLEPTTALHWSGHFLDDDRRAAVRVERALHVARESGHTRALPHLHTVHAHVLCKLGRLDAAAAAAAEAEDTARDTGRRDLLPLARAVRSRVRLLTGDRADAVASWHALDESPRPAVRWWSRLVDEHLAEAALDLDPRPATAPGAEAHAAEAVREATRTGLRGRLAAALLRSSACALERGDHSRAAADATSAATAFATASMPLHQGRALLAAAVAAGRAGDFDGATRDIGRARELFHAAGAHALLREATSAQRGLAGRQPAPRGLSRRERQVAELVVRGLGTKQIATELFLSPRTVEDHISRVLRKLELTSRAGIALKLASADTARAS
ncbi:helix-turn-helix transcriptional regulator [Saccharothrix obliqua]|uniref:helix-turn-helix transcriptional regulator n=1 Tax=Saccharothrix obliqua TaxID=2861747 RepID=UPI001C5CE5AC|nr:LuxR family transcriptional regulator [Saccharothrix obliqua]MBW4718780.1 LuxR C-terminal-related transcriptional regulator [Saccharothrix obliqua]